jgi:3-deoxy-D-manno-octulosonate 8-phosphate phosphatase (KDO 8-P phosphatase)
MTSFAWFQEQLKNNKLVEKLKTIDTIICDVDGSLTNAWIYVSEQGEGGRLFDIQDGFATVQAIKQGLRIALLSGKANKSIVSRGKALGIPEELCIGGSLDKPTVLRQIQEKYNLQASQILMYGDDFLDVQVKLSIPDVLFVTPSDSPFYISAQADLVLQQQGGHHAFRQLLDLLLFVQNKHFAQQLIQKIIL